MTGTYLRTYLHSLQTDTGEKKGAMGDYPIGLDLCSVCGRGWLSFLHLLGSTWYSVEFHTRPSFTLGQASHSGKLTIGPSPYLLGGSSSSGPPRQKSRRDGSSGADHVSSDMVNLGMRGVRRGRRSKWEAWHGSRSTWKRIDAGSLDMGEVRHGGDATRVGA